MPTASAAAQRAAVQRARAVAWPQYVVVVPFANEGGTEDCEWIGLALQQALQYKLSYVPGLQVWQYARYRPTPLLEYTMPIAGESAEQRAARLSQTLGRWTVVLGTFLVDGAELEVCTYAATRLVTTPTLVSKRRGGIEQMGELLDGAMPALLQTILPLGTHPGGEWRGKMPTQSLDALQWFARGMLAEREDIEQAGLCYQSAVDLDPSFLAARWAMAPVCRMHRDPQGALAHVNAVAVAVPDDVQVRMARAAALSGVGDFIAAAEEYQLCAKLDPRLERSISPSVIRCYSRANELDKALEWAQALLASQPDNASALISVGEVHEARGEYDKAIECFKRVMRQEPTGWRAYWYLGQCYAKMGQLDEALKQYRAGLGRQPNAIVLVRALADAYEQQGEVERAIREWQRVLDLLPPESGLAREAEQRLAALRN